jgi:hypothetical protein
VLLPVASDRRPVDPPVVVQVTTCSSNDELEFASERLFMCATLVKERKDEEIFWLKVSNTLALRCAAH